MDSGARGKVHGWGGSSCCVAVDQGDVIATGSMDNTAKLWNTETGPLAFPPLSCPCHCCTCLSLTPPIPYLASDGGGSGEPDTAASRVTTRERRVEVAALTRVFPQSNHPGECTWPAEIRVTTRVL